MNVIRKRWLLIISVIICCIAATMAWSRRNPPSTLKVFERSAADSPQRLTSVLLGPQPLKTTRWRELVVGDDPYLKIGTGVMEWSSRLEGSGYLYFHTFRALPDWEFAPCVRKQLSDVSNEDVRCDFFGADHPRGPAVFGADWKTNAIVFTTGQVVLARLLKSPALVYAIKIEEQKGQTLTVRYAEFQPARD